MENVAELMFEKGTSFYNKGKTLLKILGISFAVFVLILLIAAIGWGGFTSSLYCLAIATGYGFVDFLIVVAYLGILIGLVGVPLYFLGLHYLGLGQIAKNTENFNSERTVSEELPEL